MFTIEDYTTKFDFGQGCIPVCSQLQTWNKVRDALLFDDDDDFNLDHPDEPMMEGSDDEFSDLELGSDDEEGQI